MGTVLKLSASRVQSIPGYSESHGVIGFQLVVSPKAFIFIILTIY